jgi:M6 family metalloprotease-like protein
MASYFVSKWLNTSVVGSVSHSIPGGRLFIGASPAASRKVVHANHHGIVIAVGYTYSRQPFIRDYLTMPKARTFSTNLLFALVSFSVLLIVLIAPPIANAQPAASSPGLSGWLTIVWGDGQSGTNKDAQTRYYLTDDFEQTTRLQLSQDLVKPLGGPLTLNGKRVTVQGVWPMTSNTAFDSTPLLNVQSIQLDEVHESAGPATPTISALSGSQPWISIMCKFSDVAAAPKSLTYFQGMYANSYPGLDHYWRQQSYGNVNIAGSTAAGWYTLPQPRSTYISGSYADLDRLADDCIGVANPNVNFSSFVGINLMFNDNLDCCAWGGQQYMTLDGVTKLWRVTWEPPWGYEDITIIAHEMGHGFGLPHSSSNYGTYTNQWDVMSDAWTTCGLSSNPTYGCLGQHTIAYHKDILEWIPAAQKYTLTPNETVMVTLERLALPQTNNYQLVQIPIGGSTTRFYTVEARQRSGYDLKLPENGVIIHEVDTTRDEPAKVLDPDNNGDTGDAGARWVPGETFTDEANDITVSVDAATTSGFRITVALSPSPYAKSFTGYFRNGQWFLDINGNGRWDNGTDRAFYFGMSGDKPVTGDWNGDGYAEVGVQRGNQWYLDLNGNGRWDSGIDGAYVFGQAGDQPVAGDWDNDGATEIGVKRGGVWYLDNGNGRWDGCGTLPAKDRCISNFGWTSDQPIAGDWDNDGTAEIGVRRGASWYLDTNGNGIWNSGVDQTFNFGMAGDQPVTGDWNGEGFAGVGAKRGGDWYLDRNANDAWNGCGTDTCISNWGLSSDLPVSGRWKP